MPALEPHRVELGKRLLDSGLERADLETTMARWRNRIGLFREENVPLVAESETLVSQYNKVAGGLISEWEGDRLAPPQLRPFANSGDRDVRERAFRAFFKPYIEAHDEMAGIFERLVDLRTRIAANAGFDNYRDYQHQALNRFDYTPADCLRFHEAVEATVVPAVERLYRRRAGIMGLPDGRVRPWDALDNHVGTPDPHGRPPVRPFETEQQLIDRGRRLFDQVDPVLGANFGRMREARTLDLMSRPGKAPGAYCAMLTFRRLPFLFMNSSGVANDVDTLLHESGHAFHVFEMAAALPLYFQWDICSEIAEVASMSMELLARPYLAADGVGLYTEEEARRARVDHLEEMLTSLAHIAAVDASQHWIYTSGKGGDTPARDAEWLDLRSRFLPGVDWTGCEAEHVARWYEQPHFFVNPLYYIEYGLAQMGALQVWRHARENQAAAVAAYRRALALGGSRPLPELYAAAGAKLVFGVEEMRPLIDLVEEEIARLS